MGDSENSNNDDDDNGDHNESGSIFGKQCSASFKASKAGSLSDIVFVYKELKFLLPFSADPDTVTELSQMPFQYPWGPKYLLLSKAKQNKATKTFLLLALS